MIASPLTTRTYRLSAGIGAGAGAALIMLLVMGLLRLIFGLLTIPELMLNPILKMLGGQTFSDLLDRWYYAGRPLLFATILEGALLLGALLGLLYAALARPKPVTGARPALLAGPWGGALYGLLVGVLLNLVFLPIVGQPPFASSPQGIFSTSQVPLWLGLMLLALVYGLVLHLLLPRTAAPFFAAPDLASDGGIEVDDGRRDFLRVLGGSLLALAGGALFAGAGTILNQGGLQSPVSNRNLADGASEGAGGSAGGGAPAPPPTPSEQAQAAQPDTRPAPTSEPTASRPTSTAEPPTSTPQPQPTAEPPTPTVPPADTPAPIPTETPLPPPPTEPPPTPVPPTPVPPTPTSVPVIMVQEITPTGSFYHVSKNFFDPQPTADSWRLEVKGLVNTPYTLTYNELVALPSQEVVVAMMCISNPIGGGLIGNTRWRGVRLADLIARAKPRKGVVDVAFSAADGYTDSITYQKATDPDVVLVWEMDGRALNHAHGYPARLLVPGIYGMKHIKWITVIELVSHDFRGFWQQPDQGWSEPAPVNTMSKIDFPAADKPLKVGRHTLSGVAFAGDRSISKVEVSTDGGKTWAEAYVKPPLSHTAWVVWAYEWTPAGPGKYTVKVRATDGDGKVQPSKRTDPYPNGATGHHTLVYTVK